MRRRYILLCGFIMTLGALISCGMWMGRQAAAPMARQQGQVSAALSVLPENLFDAELLASGGNPIVRKDGGTLYEVMRQAYRRMELPIEGEVVQIAPAPDGGLWLVIRQGGGLTLTKTNLQGTVLVQQELTAERVQSIVCDIIGHVFLAVEDGRVQRYSPTGELQGEAALECGQDSVRLAVQKERVFARVETGGSRGRYIEILPELTIRAAFDACQKKENVYPVGSFLPEYIMMEHDAVGLYACREDGVWETVALWEDLHLDGNVREKMLSDAQGRGILLYEKNGETYVLTLSQAKK